VPLWKVGVFVGDIVVEGDSDGVTVYTEGVIIGESDTLTTVIAS
jgi:hypothetical protein